MVFIRIRVITADPTRLMDMDKDRRPSRSKIDLERMSMLR
jgi:hypothetical protein